VVASDKIFIFSSRIIMAEEEKDLSKLDAEALVERLTPGQVRQLIDENEGDPDDPSLPASVRTAYRCERPDTGAYDRQKLLDFLEKQVRPAYVFMYLHTTYIRFFGLPLKATGVILSKGGASIFERFFESNVRFTFPFLSCQSNPLHLRAPFVFEAVAASIAAGAHSLTSALFVALLSGSHTSVIRNSKKCVQR
jgi:hypothetical protein